MDARRQRDAAVWSSGVCTHGLLRRPASCRARLFHRNTLAADRLVEEVASALSAAVGSRVDPELLRDGRWASLPALSSAAPAVATADANSNATSGSAAASSAASPQQTLLTLQKAALGAELQHVYATVEKLEAQLRTAREDNERLAEALSQHWHEDLLRSAAVPPTVTVTPGTASRRGRDSGSPERRFPAHLSGPAGVAQQRPPMRLDSPPIPVGRVAAAAALTSEGGQQQLQRGHAQAGAGAVRSTAAGVGPQYAPQSRYPLSSAPTAAASVQQRQSQFIPAAPAHALAQAAAASGFTTPAPGPRRPTSRPPNASAAASLAPSQGRPLVPSQPPLAQMLQQQRHGSVGNGGHGGVGPFNGTTAVQQFHPRGSLHVSNTGSSRQSFERAVLSR
jgi:hypothetical protein